MSKDTLYDFNIDAPESITDELYTDVGSSAFVLGTVKRAFKGATDVVIRTAASGGGDLLIEGTDYNIVNEDFEYTEQCGYHVYTGIQVLTVGYQTGNLYISYKAVGSYTTVAALNDLFASLSLLANTWATGVAYTTGQILRQGYTLYQCKTNHTSGTFTTDWIINGYWVPLTTPPGSIRESSAYDKESNELLCDGSAISRTTYSILYDRITRSKGTFTVTIASPGVFTLTGHGLLTGHCVELTTTGALPTGLAVNTNYYVIWVSADTFRLATSLANALAGTAINTSGSQSGTHSLRFCPWGISTASNFLLPNFQAVVPKGAGTQTINTRSKTAPPFGGVEEDQGAEHEHLLRGATSSSGTGGNIGEAAMQGLYSSSQTGGIGYRSTFGSGNRLMTGYNAVSGGETPRMGLQTRENSVGVNFFIKYE